jgi:hypothetical protein
MVIGQVYGIDPWYKVPIFRGQAARGALTKLHGLPNAAPEQSGLEGIREEFSRECRLLFVDDDQSGRPMAVWLPEGKQ